MKRRNFFRSLAALAGAAVFKPWSLLKPRPKARFMAVHTYGLKPYGGFDTCFFFIRRDGTVKQLGEDEGQWELTEEIEADKKS